VGIPTGGALHVLHESPWNMHEAVNRKQVWRDQAGASIATPRKYIFNDIQPTPHAPHIESLK